MNNQPIFSQNLLELLVTSEELVNRIKTQCITRMTLLGALALRQKSIFHKYLVAHNLNDTEITEKVADFWEKNREKLNSIEIGKIYSEDYTFIVSKEVLNTIIHATKIAKNLYNTNIVTEEYVLATLAETYTEEYLDLLILCIGKNAEVPETAIDNISKNKLIIPKNLSSFLYVLNDDFSPSETSCKILGREDETNQLIHILSKATKRNAILVGEPGVGKTAIVEKLAWKVTTGHCHEKLKDTKVVGLEVNSILAGTHYRGSAEERFNELIKFLEQNPNCILFIDEIHTILGAGACRDGDLDLANALKPILARGETRVIGATTKKEYEKYFSRDGALKRRFEKIIVEEPHSDEVYEMIKNQILNLENFHQTTISKNLVDFAILNASCFNYETKNPDRTLDLIDKSMAIAELNGRHQVSKEDVLSNFDIRRKQFECMTEEKKRATAYHEAGHFILQNFSEELKDYSSTLAVSIMPAEGYLGVHVEEINDNHVPSSTKMFYIQMIGKMLAGRIAEEMYSNEISSGAASDLAKATKIAKKMVMSYGLSDTFKNHIYEDDESKILCDKSTIEKINKEIDKILVEAENYATDTLNNHKKELELIVEGLIKYGILSKKELDEILSDKKRGLFKNAIGDIFINS